MAPGTLPCGIALPQVFSDTAVDINLIQQFVQKAETLAEFVRAGAQRLLLNPMFDDRESLEMPAQEVMPHL